MTDLKDAVRDYYDEQTLDDAALARVMSGRPRRADLRRRWFTAAAVAATLIAVVLGASLGGRAWLAPATMDKNSAEMPRLVAVQIRADWCPRTPELSPVFTDLLADYGNQPLLFVTFDITDDTRREQARMLSASLGIPEAFDEPFGSGMIKLIDRRSHELLAAITGREQVPELESRIAEALHVPGGGV